jgi:hypothetical protein
MLRIGYRAAPGEGISTPIERNPSPEAFGFDLSLRERWRKADPRYAQRIATGLIMLCTPPLKRGWPRTNRNS